jgi:diacylglycerol kinase family enzyme
VSSALVGTQMPLGVLPAGTLNHFAGDLGIPTQLDDAARAIADAWVIRIDVAKVNGRPFVNNSSIGIYPAMVRTRDALMQKGLPKRLATVGGVLAAFWEFPNTVVRLKTSDTELITRTPFVFVGNNTYQLSGLQVGKRKGLQDGILQVCSVSNPGRRVLFRTLIGAIAGNADAAPELTLSSAKEVRITTLRKRIPVAIDGEVITMTSPLVYSICPGALNVMAPRET